MNALYYHKNKDDIKGKMRSAKIKQKKEIQQEDSPTCRANKKQIYKDYDI